MTQRRYGVIDVETTPLTHGEWPRTKFWGLYDGKTYRRFATTKALTKFLATIPATRFFHHYNFDVLQLLLDGAPVKIVKTHNTRIIASTISGHRLVNSFSLFPVSLEKILAAYGLKKVSLEKLDERNYSDCVDGYNCIMKLCAEIENVCGIDPLDNETMGSVAAAAARKVAGPMPIDRRFLNAFRGGRVEVFDLRPHGSVEVFAAMEDPPPFLGWCVDKQVSAYDLNSSYWQSICEAQRKEKLLKVRVKTNDWYCPLFNARNFERLEFPNGEFNSWVFRNTLDRYILPHVSKTSIKILKTVTVDATWLVMLREYLLSLYCLKEKHKGTGRGEAAKFLGNATYGRIGLRPEREICVVKNHVAGGREVLWSELPNGMFISFFKVQTSPKSNYSLAALITDNARGRLYEGFTTTEALYGDTDSVYSSLQRTRLRLGQSIGEWKNQGCGNFVARAPKDYFFNGKAIRKGGREFFKWTLKTLVSGKPVSVVERQRIGTLEKRVVNVDGTTRPNIVNTRG